MITPEFAMCRAPGLYPLCENCKRNMDNHPSYVQSAIRQRHWQAAVSPDSRPECRHHTPLDPEPRL